MAKYLGINDCGRSNAVYLDGTTLWIWQKHSCWNLTGKKVLFRIVCGNF